MHIIAQQLFVFSFFRNCLRYVRNCHGLFVVVVVVVVVVLILVNDLHLKSLYTSHFTSITSLPRVVHY